MATETGEDADAAFDVRCFLLKQELARQAQCADNPDTECDDAEVTAFLKLLGVLRINARRQYPRQAQQSECCGRQRVIHRARRRCGGVELYPASRVRAMLA